MTYSIESPTSLCDRCQTVTNVLTARQNSWLCRECLPSLPQTTHEMLGRERKVKAAALLMLEARITPEEFSRMSEGSWALLARGVRDQFGLKCQGFSLESRVAIAEALSAATQGVSNAA